MSGIHVRVCGSRSVVICGAAVRTCGMPLVRRSTAMATAAAAGFGAFANIRLVPALFAAVIYCVLCPCVTDRVRWLWAGATICALVITNACYPSSTCAIVAFAILHA